MLKKALGLYLVRACLHCAGVRPEMIGSQCPLGAVLNQWLIDGSRCISIPDSSFLSWELSLRYSSLSLQITQQDRASGNLHSNTTYCLSTCLPSFLPPFELLYQCFLETAFKSLFALKTLYPGVLLGEYKIRWRLFNFFFFLQFWKLYLHNFISAGSMKIYIHI